MSFNINNIFEIAKKEFTDHVSSNVFLAFAATFTLVVMAQSYVSGMHLDYSSSVLGAPNVMEGFRGMSMVVGIFAPLIGIVMGFDAVVKELRASTMNVLLTHPVFRDTIILGKLLGAGLCILLTFVIAINVAAGVMFYVGGMPVTMDYLIRLEFFLLIASLYSFFFLSLSIFVSVIINRSNVSLLYCLSIWLLSTVLFSQLLYTSVFIITDDLQTSLDATRSILWVTPVNHYAQASAGMQDVMKYLEYPLPINGIFDTAHSLSAWLREFWSSLVYLLVTPVLFLIASFIAFLRKDITL